jgi:hypothetical protein
MTQASRTRSTPVDVLQLGGSETPPRSARREPPTPMTRRQQAKRQYAGDAGEHRGRNLDLTANNGNSLPGPWTRRSRATASKPPTSAPDPGDRRAARGPRGRRPDRRGQGGVRQDHDCTDAYQQRHRHRHGVSRARRTEGARPGLLSQGVAPSSSTARDPNPFTTGREFRYAVKDGGEVVDIGVYDVAGRLVRRWRAATSAGLVRVRWDAPTRRACG